METQDAGEIRILCLSITKTRTVVIMNDDIGTVRREDHDDGYSLFLLVKNWDDNYPRWRCVYSTNPGNVGCLWSDNKDSSSIHEATRVVGTVPHTPGARLRHGDSCTNTMDLAELVAAMARHLGEEFPAPPLETAMRQGLSLAEEAGEAVGALRRYLGLARRPGTLADLEDELADVIFTTYLVAHYTDIDLDAALRRKAEKVFARGWREGPPKDLVDRMNRRWTWSVEHGCYQYQGRHWNLWLTRGDLERQWGPLQSAIEAY